ncbi:MAG: tetratricopeptide repeat protein [Alphaproteobacteria bacterium]|nr:tetratricopeptide repeat protein [Alphaproteobacteria bacterium]
MQKFLLIAVLLCGVLITMTARADQTDERLDELFQILRGSDDLDKVGLAEQAIWGIWMKSGDDEMDLLLEQGAMQMQARQFGAALSMFNTVIAERPEFAEGWNKRATLYYLMGELDRSIADCEKTLALEPRHFGALFGLGLIYAAKRQEDKAIASLERALMVHPHLSNAVDFINELKSRLKSREV